MCADSPEPSLLDNAISTKTPCAGSLRLIYKDDYPISWDDADQCSYEIFK